MMESTTRLILYHDEKAQQNLTKSNLENQEFLSKNIEQYRISVSANYATTIYIRLLK